jgi:plasmid replication initiation protein
MMTKSPPPRLRKAPAASAFLPSAPDSAASTPANEPPTQLSLFVVDSLVADWPIKDDMSSMEQPIFSLSKNKDTRIREYSRGGRTLRIIPSVAGAATVFDKDVLIYALSLIVHGENAGMQTSRRVRIESHPFLVETRRSTGGAAYERIIDMCRRLKGTTIETNIKTNEREQTEGFSLIEDYKVNRATKSGKGALEIEITISDWFYRAAKAYDVLTLHRDYFSLSMPLERRLYELARKHVGDKAYWTVGIDILHEKSGTTQEIKYFRREINRMMEANRLPEYKLAIDDSTRPAKAVFFTRNNQRLLAELNKANLLGWYSKLTQRLTPQ